MIKNKNNFSILVLIIFGLANYSSLLSQNISVDKTFDLLKSNKHNDAINNFTELIKINDTIANFYYGRGVAYLYSEKYSEAIEDFERTIAINENYVDAYYGLVVSYLNQNDYQSAKTFINKVITLDSNYYEMFYVRGMIYYLEKNYKSAVKDFSYVLENRNSLNALYGRAITHYQLNNLTEFSTDIETFLANNKTENILLNECYRLLNIIKKNF